MLVDFIYLNQQNDSFLEGFSFYLCFFQQSFVLFFYLIKNNEDLCMLSYFEYLMKGMIVLFVFKYFSLNLVTLLQKNVNIFKQLLILFVLILLK